MLRCRLARSLPFLVLLLLTARGLAQVNDPAAVPQGPLPVVEPQTFLVMRIDFNLIDPNTLNKWLADRVNESTMPADLKPQMIRQLSQGFTMMGTYRSALMQAGAPRLYLVFSATDFPADDDPMMYAPMAPESVPAAVASILYSSKADGPTGPDPATAEPRDRVTGQLGQGMFMGRAATYKRLQAIQPNAELQMNKLLAEAPPAAFQIVYLSQEPLNQMFEKMAPQIPAPVDAPMTTVTRGVRYAIGTAQAPPGPSARAMIKASDAAAATELKARIEKLLATLATPEWQQRMAGFDVKPFAELVKPVVKGDELSLELDDAKLQKLAAGPLSTALIGVRQATQVTNSMSIMRQALMGVIMYANDNQGKLPDNLNQTTKYFGGRLMPNPRGGPAEPDFIYIKPAATMRDVKNPGQVIVLHENPDDLAPNIDPINVGFADGHVEAIARERLKARLAAQQAAQPAPK